MHPHIVFFCERAQCGNVIKQAVRPAGGGTGDKNRVPVNGFFHGGDIGPIIVAQGNALDLNAGVFAPFGKCRVDGVGDNDVGLENPFFQLAPFLGGGNG